jgi:multiple sugar transport system permease protein
MSSVDTTARGRVVVAPRGGGLLGRDWRLGFALTLPVLIIIIGLIAYPFAYSVWLSLHDVKVGGEGRWVGLGNYTRILFDLQSPLSQAFYNSIKVSFLYTAGAMVGKFIIGMTTALILSAQIKARNFWRMLLFLPWAIPGIVSAYSWKWMYNDINGVINTILLNWGLIDRPILFLADPNIALWAVLAAVIWQGTPFWTMTFLAGLQAIPRDMYEAAEIDGAGTAQTFWYITLPNMTTVITVTLMLSAIWTANAIQYVYILTLGGPGNATETFPILAYNQGIRAYDLGIGATVPLIFFPVFAVMIYFLTRRMLRQGA